MASFLGNPAYLQLRYTGIGLARIRIYQIIQVSANMLKVACIDSIINTRSHGDIPTFVITLANLL